MTPRCVCGSYVSERYVRVFAPEDVAGEADVRACPHCNLIRGRDEIREARSHNDYDVEVEKA